jgi:diguanylate cyclase (GGDEF)-like protein
MANVQSSIKKTPQPLKGPLISLVAAGFSSGLFMLAGFWLLNTNLGMASTLFAVILVFVSLTFLLIAVRVYAHISLSLAQNDQKHLQNALIQAKDMLDTSKQLREEQILLQSLLQNLPFPVWLKDRFGRYLVSNQAFVDQWCNGTEPKGLTDAELLNGKLVDSFAEADQKALSTGQVQKLELRFDFADKSAKWVRIERYALQGEDGQSVGVLGFAIDISSYKKDFVSESELLKDPITQFLNQTGLTKYMEHAELADIKTYCVQIDIDHFKVMNDSLGQASGDKMLAQVAERILVATTPGDVLSRTSADEFVLFLHDASDEDIQKRLEDLHDQLKLPITLGETQYSFTTSFGVAQSPDHGDSHATLKQNAGVALFNAKKLGRNQIHWYHDGYEDQAIRRLNKEQLLRQAITEQDLEIHIQPRIDCRNGNIDALECLVRIQMENGELMYPGNFIELAEQNGLIRELDTFMLESALVQIQDWLNEGVKPLPLAINLSIQSFNDNLLDHLAQWQVRKPEVFDFLELELTEHRLPEKDTNFMNNLHAIREFNIRLALDDFGTGYANLSRLPEWPFQILKLDRSFIIDLPNSEKQQAVVKSIIDLCATLDIQVVAEGVETEEELTLIDRLGCHCIQGFVYARPKPLADINDWLTQRKISAQ